MGFAASPEVTLVYNDNRNAERPRRPKRAGQVRRLAPMSVCVPGRPAEQSAQRQCRYQWPFLQLGEQAVLMLSFFKGRNTKGVPACAPMSRNWERPASGTLAAGIGERVRST